MNENVKKTSSVKIIALALFFSIIGGIIGMSGAAMYFQNEEDTNISLVSSVEVDSSNVTTLTSVSGTELSASDLYSQNVGACVGISVSNVTTNAFGQVSSSASSGSGFVVTSDGYIVTNCHVIADAIDSDSITIEVSFYDGKTYSATLVGYEEDNDVAVLKIEATDLQTVTIGDSSTLEVGETVYAIGNPLGELTFSLTDGLVSALDRLISTDDDVTMNMFQTNTAINPGNSGGPIFNASGEVIGIATAKYSVSSSGTTVEGLGFAIPINDVLDIILDLMDYGYVTGKPYMGVQVADAKYYGGTSGAAVSFVAEDGAADEAGLEVGDIIIAIDATVIDTSSALTAAITAYSAGDTAILTVLRGDETFSLTIIFDEKNDETESANQIVVEENTTNNQQSQNQQTPSRP